MNTKFDCEIQTEEKDAKGNVVKNDTLVKRYPEWANSREDAREQVIARHGEVYLKAKNAPELEVKIICRPFRSE